MDFAEPRQPLRVHGGIDLAELKALGVSPAEVLDLSVNVNPYGPSPAVMEAIRAARVDQYPDPSAVAVREAIAARAGVPLEQVVFGAGAADLLWTLARALLSPGRRLLIVEPAFSELRAAAAQTGADIRAWRTGPEQEFRIDLDAVADAALEVRADLVALCAPSSPAGAPVAVHDVAHLAQRLSGKLVLLDESFLALSDRAEDLARPLPENVLRLRSLTKAHAIPGLRAGYLLAPTAIARSVERGRPAWSTSSLAQAAALTALGEEAFVERSRLRLRADREAIAAGLQALGLRPIPSVAPYLVFPAGDAAALRRRLLARGVLVRDCASFGLPAFVRVAARPAADRARLLNALSEELR